MLGQPAAAPETLIPRPRAAAEVARRAKVDALRARFLAGTLDEVLVPQDVNIDALLADVLGRGEAPVGQAPGAAFRP